MAAYDAFREQGERLAAERRRYGRAPQDANMGPSGSGFSWLDRPAGIRNFAGEKTAQTNQDADFLAKYGMTAADMVEAYRLGKVKEGTTPGGPATQSVGRGPLDLYGRAGAGGVGMPEPNGLGFDVGQRFRDGKPVLETGPETVKLTGEQNDLKSAYAKMRERLELMQGAAVYNKGRALTLQERIELEREQAANRERLKQIAPGGRSFDMGGAATGLDGYGGAGFTSPYISPGSMWYGPSRDEGAIDARGNRIDSKLSGKAPTKKPIKDELGLFK